MALILAAAGLLTGALACDRVPLTAPTESTIALFANAASVPLNGSIDIIATVTEEAGTPVQNGTVVTFTTTLGRIEPAEARTSNGKVTVRLVSDGRSGTARITAFSGAASGELELPVGAAAATNVVLRAEPASVGANGGSVQLVATVRDESGNPIAGVPVTFTTTAGQIASSSVTSDANGEARTTLTTTRQAEVTARAGGQEAQVTVSVQAAPTVSLTVSPQSPTANQPAVFTITVTPASDGAPVQSVTIDFGDGERLTLGSGSTTVSHVYSSSGTYTVTARVRDAAGQETVQTLVLIVLPAAPIAVNLSASPTAPVVNEVTTFTAQATPPAGVSIQRYRWDFGDGTAVVETTGDQRTHVFTSAGRRTVTVRAYASDGSIGVGQTEVNVVQP